MNNFQKNRNKHAKLSGFTIIEITVVALITSIVMGLGYTGLLMVQQNYSKQNENKLTVNEIALFRSVLSKNFFSSKTITWDENTQVLQFDNLKSLKFGEDAVVYSHFKIDSFKVAVSGIKVNQLTTWNQESLVTNFKLEFDYLEAPSSYLKKYSDYQINGL